MPITPLKEPYAQEGKFGFRQIAWAAVDADPPEHQQADLQNAAGKVMGFTV